MIAYNDNPDIRLVEYFEKTHRMRVPLRHACEIRLGLEWGQTEFYVSGRCVVTDIPVNILEFAEDLRRVLH